MTDNDRIEERFDEIKELYEISDAETVLLGQMQAIIQMLGYSPKLTLKLLKALTSMLEVTHEFVGDDKKKNNK